MYCVLNTGSPNIGGSTVCHKYMYHCTSCFSICWVLCTCMSLSHFQREKLDLKRLHGVVDPQELALTHPQVSCEDHMTELHEQYKQVEDEYLKVIEKLAASAET